MSPKTTPTLACFSPGRARIRSNAIPSGGNQNAGNLARQRAGNVIRSNTIVANANWGVFQTNGSSGQSIYDNYLSNTGNAGFNGGGNAWNTSLMAATNSVGGP